MVVAQQTQYALDVVAAGFVPAARLSDEWKEVMRERGFQFAPNRLMPIEEVNQGSYDAVISLAAEDLCPWISGMIRESWPFEGVGDSEIQRYRVLRDMEEKIEKLLKRVCASADIPAEKFGQQN
jgi:protein-tyrosine-phosphatase